jgi:26S proteasome regulatory subunit N10
LTHWMVPCPGDNEEASLERALAMSVEGQTQASPHHQTPDFSHMTEEEQIAFAMQMSLQDSRE